MRLQRGQALLVLHGAPRDGAFHLWGESSRARRARKTTLPRAASARALVDALSSLDLSFDPAELEHWIAQVWLPTVERNGRRSAVPSSRMVGPIPAGERALVAWEVDALALELDYAIELASLLGGERMVAPGVVLGRDFLFWQVVLRFAARLVAEGRFLPSAGKSFGGWRALLDGADAEALHALARAMPGAARALGEDAPGTSPLSLMREVVDRAVDLIVTAGAMRSPTPSPSRGLHDRWLRALRGRDRLATEGGEATRLENDCRDWLQPVERSAQLPYRLCLRISEPAGDADPWTIDFLLQSKEDPSLLLEAGPILQDDAAPLARETLLSFSSQAFRLVPELADWFDDLAGGIPLTGHQALAFLSERAPALEAAGFRVMLPSWWTRREASSLRARARIPLTKESGGGGLTLDAVVRFDWEIALGDQTLTESELARLAQLKSPLVQMRGRWVFFDPKHLEAALRLAAEGPRRASVVELVRLALGADAPPGQLPFEGVEGHGEAGDLIDALTGRAAFAEIEPPESFAGHLRPYQRRGFSWLEFLGARGLGACLADDMGLGKTVQALAAVLLDRERDRRRVPYLLICPTSVIGNWQREAERFAPSLGLVIHHGPGRAKSKKALSKTRARKDLVITSYSLLSRDSELLTSVSWSGVILDEAQNVKNPDAGQSRAARGLSASRRIALTGTPVENDVGELWSLMEFLNPGFLGGRTEFRKRFFVPIQASRDREAVERLRRLTSPFILRRLKTDRAIIDDLPEKQEMDVFCHLTREQASLYAAVVKDAEATLRDADGMKRRGVILATLSKLKQVCNHPAQFLRDDSPLPGRSGKLARLEEMLAEATAGGDRALVFTQFAEMGTLLTEHLQRVIGREVAFLHGAVPKKSRDEMVLRFQEDPDGPPLFVLSLKAGGTGLNLTRANHVFFFDRWWNPAVENQAMDRAFRIGQLKNVQVHKLVCLGTLEEEICRMIREKEGRGRLGGHRGRAVADGALEQRARRDLRAQERGGDGMSTFGKRRPVPAGIKARAQSGRIGTGAWARRWLGTLEGFGLGSRLSRGRTYARSGQVTAIDVELGEVRASVQGSRPTPYQVRVSMRPFPDAIWDRILESVRAVPALGGRLLNGELPPELEQITAETHHSLFPKEYGDLETECTCPDWEVPCKHLAALFYLIGEELDRDPRLILKLRGLEPERLRLALVGVSDETPAQPEPTPLPSDDQAFWEGGELDPAMAGSVDPAADVTAVLKRLGPFPFWSGTQPITESLEPVYRAAGAFGLELLLGHAFDTDPS